MNQPLMKLLATFCLSICSIPGLLSAQQVNLNKKYSADAAREFFHSTMNELSLKHPGMYRYHTRTNFKRYIDSTANTITDSISVLSLYRKLKPTISRIGCLHTGISLPQNALNDKPNHLPLQIIFRDNKAWIVNDYFHDHKELIGKEVLSINVKPMNEILGVLLPAIPSDGYNKTMKYLALDFDFARWYAAMIETPAQFNVMIATDDGPRDVVLEGMFRNKIPDFEKSFEGDGSPRLAFRAEKNYSVLTVKSFSNSAIKRGGQKYKSFIKTTFKNLKKNQTQNLIIDLRYNTGGTDGNAVFLTRHLFDKSFRYWDRIEVTPAIGKEIKGFAKLFYKKPVKGDSLYRWRKVRFSKETDYYKTQSPANNNFKGNLYVLTNGFCMSSCSDVVAVLHANKRATFIGEETGGGYQGNTSGLMPTVSVLGGMRLTVPLLKYTNAVDPKVNIGRGTIPDHIVISTADDIVNKKDPVMEYVIGLIQ
jgi:hypothetical protein